MKSMKIGIQTWGTNGDVRPLIALAGGLSSAGHQVKLVVTSVDGKTYDHFGKSLNFEVEQTGNIFSPDAYASVAEQLGKENNPLKQLALLFTELFDPAEREMYSASRRLCEESDIVIGQFLIHPLRAAAEISGRPFMSVTLNHSAIPTQYMAPGGIPNRKPAEGLGPDRLTNSSLWNLFMAVIDKQFLPRINRLRLQEGLAPAGSVREVWESDLLNLIAVSPVFCSQDPEWGSNQQVCGFFNLPETAEQYQMPGPLMDFLRAGPPPVYMTFGSLLPQQAGSPLALESTRLLVGAARLAGCRAIIQSCWNSLDGIEDDRAIYRLTNVPHHIIFPHCCAVVHHGGAGTTQSATRAGCPSVVVAHMTDQSFWGNELRRLGIAPGLLNRHSVTADKLAAAISSVLASPGMKTKASELGERIRREDGVGRAVEEIEKKTVSLL
ncbi:MAG: glycosyltransferase [Nitrospirae bacterium]|nr:MAG: glycosyltransferase [Nitrospirota bacterium]